MTAALSLLDAALLYARLGWPVVPLHTPVQGVCDCPKRVACGDSAGKHPRTMHGIDDSSTDTDKIERWWRMWPHANIAVDLIRANLVDVAPDSLQWQAEFIARGLPRTPRFRSGGGDGHEHSLYKRPDTCPAYRLCRPDEYDLLSAGYAVMPPSLHSSGQQYAWLEPPTSPLAVAPAWAVSMLQESARSRLHLNGTAAALDPDEAPVQLSSDDLALWDGSAIRLKPDGTLDRSLSLWEIGRALARAGASRSAIARALQERDESLGWSKYTARRDAATRYAIIAERALSGEAPRVRLKPADRGDRGNHVSDSCPATVWAKPISVLLAQPETPVVWLCEPLFSVGASGFIAAEPKIGKSWIALDLAYCLATGCSFLGRFAVASPRRVLFIEEEDPERRMLRRFKRLLRGTPERGQPNDSMFRYVCRSGFRLDDAQWIATLRAELDNFKPDVIVLDVFNKLHLKDENSQAEISAILHDLGGLTREYGVAFLIVHHYRKSGIGQSARGNQMLRGTSALAGYAECSLYLRKGKGKHVIVCEPESKDAPELEPFEIRLEDTDNDGTRLIAAETPSRVREAEEEQAALEAIDVLEQDGKDIIADNVGQVTGWESRKANRVLSRLTAIGRLDAETLQVGRKGYRLYRLAAVS